MVSHLVSSFLQLPFLDGPDPSLDETLYVFLRNIRPPRARKSLCEHSRFSVVIFLKVLERGTVGRLILLVSSKCSRSLHSPIHRRQWHNVSFTFSSETCLTLVSGLNSSGEQFISLPDNADRTLQITASVLLCGFMRLNFRFWDSTPHNKRVYFQSAQCRCGVFPPSERSHSWACHVAIHK